jgi:hypothetical protein
MHTDETRIKTNNHPCFIRENLWLKEGLNQGQTRVTDYRFLFSRSGLGEFGRQIRGFAGIEEKTGAAMFLIITMAQTWEVIKRG